MRLSLPTRIFLGFAGMIVCFGATALYGLAAVTAMRHELWLLRSRALPLLGTLRDHGLELRGYDEALGRAAPHDLEWVARFAPNARPFQRLDAITSQLSLLQGADQPPRLARLLVAPAAPLPEVEAELARARRDHEAARRIGRSATLVAILPGATTPSDDEEAFEMLVAGLQRAAADRRGDDAARLVVETRRIIRRVHAAVGRAERQLEDALQTRFATAARSESRLLAVVLAASAIALAVSVGVLLWMLASLRPMAALAAAVRRLASGERGVRASRGGASEIDSLAAEFNRMADALDARERQISAAREELARAEQLAAVGQMAARMTHEVRNPLSSIGLNAEMLGDELGRMPAEEVTEARSLLGAIGAEVERLRGITERYLAHARPPTTGEVTLDLGDLVRAVLDFAAVELDQRAVRLHVDLAPGCRVCGQEGPLRQAVWNLLRNAWEAMPSGGRLQVTVGRTRGEAEGADAIVLAVEDDGPGIAAEARERIFEPFFTTKQHGTGVGLAVVRETARAHGGRVEVATGAAGGARLEVWLPPAPPAERGGGDLSSAGR